MASISTTANATGQATAAVVILNWLLTGHPTPIPTDVAVAMGGYLALIGHAVEQAVEAAYAKWMARLQSAPATLAAKIDIAS